MADPHEDAAQQARARALASPLRMRILRLCLHEPRTNKELAGMLGINPGSMLHHVRSLVSTGFLEPGYRRYITRRLRETFGFEGTPIELSVRVREKRQRKR